MPYLKDIIHNPKKSDTLEIQLTIAITSISSKDNDEEHVMHSKSDNKETKTNHKADEVIEKLFKTFLDRYQNDLETSIRGSNFIFDCVHLLYCKCHKINPSRGGSYINSFRWIKNKKATRNSIKTS